MDIINPKETQEKISNNGIRKATLFDVPEIARINVECWKHNYKGIVAQDVLDDMSVEKHVQRWLDNFEERQKNMVFYLKECNGKIIGFISGGSNNYPKIPYENEINLLYVDIHQQGKHVGKELFERLLEDEKFKDCSSFYLRTLRDNPQSNHFYTKMGGKTFSETLQKMRKGPDVPMVGYYRQK